MVDGADITDFKEGKSFANWEHLQKDNGKHTPGSEIVGKVIFAKKIYKEEDCEDDRQLYFWRQVEEPMIYGIVRMFDNQEGHESAKHISAIIRDSVQHKEPLTIGFSIEGSTLKRHGAKLEKTVCKAVAITVRPCNKTAYMGILRDAALNIDKTQDSVQKDEDSGLTPLHAKIGGHEMDYGPEMLKALSAGSGDASPSSLTQGAALQIEALDKQAARKKFKSRFMGALRDWPGDGDLKKFMKAKLPEVSDEFLEHFQEIVDSKGVKFKKGEPEKADEIQEDDTSFDFGANVEGKEADEELFNKAKAHISRMRSPHREMAEGWLKYTRGETTERPSITPEMEKKLARFGIVDPQGYTYDAYGRDMARPIGGKRSFGVEPPELKRRRLENMGLYDQHQSFATIKKAEELTLQMQELEVDLKKSSHESIDPYNPDKHIFYAVGQFNHEEGQDEKLLGKLFRLGDDYHVIEDHGLPEGIDDPHIDLLNQKEFEEWMANRTEAKEKEPDHQLVSLIHEIADPSKDIPEYMAFRLDRGEGKLSTLLATPKAVYLDGHQLDEEEIERVMSNIQNGAMSLTHAVEDVDMKKMEPELKASLEGIRAAVKAGHLKPEHLKGITSKIFTSSMIPTMGNKMAYNDFLSRPKEGYHVHVDLAGFGKLNKAPFNYQTGDKAIKDSFTAMREALDETVGRKLSKAWHISGDEARAHLPTKEHAIAFSKAFGKKLAALPKIGGVHQLAASIGYGPTPEHAEDALTKVKAEFKTKGFPDGQMPTHHKGHDDTEGFSA